MGQEKEIQGFLFFGPLQITMEQPPHQPESITPQTENCLNCGTRLEDRWCSHCGQDSKEFKRSIWHVFMQFFETFTDFDSKLWSSLGPLLIKPGFLTKEFLAGRRKSYLNPIQMYAFFSFIFFLTAFYMPNFNDEGSLKEEIKKELVDSLKADKEKDFSIGKDSSGGLRASGSESAGDSSDSEDQKEPFQISGIGKSVRQYDSIQAGLPPEKRHNTVMNFVVRRLTRINERFKDNHEQMISAMVDAFKGNLPNLIILLLPLFALVLKLLFIRSRIFYVEHLIMAIHFHCFSFFLLSIWLIITSFVVDSSDLGLFLSQLVLFIYLYKTFRNVYQQGRIKTFVKVNLLGFTYFLMLGIGMVLNLFLSALTLD